MQLDPTSILNYLINQGVPQVHALGMVNNIAHESAFNPAAIGDNGNAAGLFQHNGPRMQGMVAALGNDWANNWQGQVDYALAEPDTKSYLQKQFQTPEDATKDFTINWERPANAQAKAAQRASQPANIGMSDNDILAAMGEQPTVANNATPQPAKNKVGMSDDEILSVIGNIELPPAQPVAQAGQQPGFMQQLLGNMVPPPGSLPLAGTVVGGALGTGVGGPLGGLAGAGGGAFVGKNVEDILRTLLLGEPAKTTGEEFKSAGQAGVAGAEQQAGGAILGKVLNSVAGAAKGGGRALVNWATKTNKPEVADYVANELGGDVAANAEKVGQLTAARRGLAKGSDAVVDMTRIAGNPSLMARVEKEVNTGNIGVAKRLFERVMDYANKGLISAKDADKLRTDLGQASHTEAGSKLSNETAKLMRSVASMIKEDLAGQIPGYKEALGKEASSIALEKGLAKPTNINGLMSFLQTILGKSTAATRAGVPLIQAGSAFQALPPEAKTAAGVTGYETIMQLLPGFRDYLTGE